MRACFSASFSRARSPGNGALTSLQSRPANLLPLHATSPATLRSTRTAEIDTQHLDEHLLPAMPPKRRSQVSRTSSSGQQSTLSFHGKHNKVTKPSAAQQTKAAKKEQALSKDVVDIETPIDDETTTADEAIQQQTKQEAATVDAAPDPLDSQGTVTSREVVLGGRAQQSDAGALGGKGSGWVGDEEEQARKVSDTQIKRYWRQKEQQRLAPRVHQEDLSVYEKVLREWDMSNQYGVSIDLRITVPLAQAR